MSTTSANSFDQLSQFEIKVNEMVAKHVAKMSRCYPTRKMLRPGYITKLGRGRCGKIKRLLKSSKDVSKDEQEKSSSKSEVYDFTNKSVRKVFESNNNKSGSENLNSGDYSKAFMSFCHENSERKNMPWDGVVTKKPTDRKRKSEKEDESKNGKLKDPLRDIEIGNIRSGNFAEDQFDQNFDVMVDNFIKLEEEELRLNREMRMNKRRKIVEVNLTNDDSLSGSKSSKQGGNKATQNSKINKIIQQGAKKLLAKNAPEISSKINSQAGKKPTLTINHPTSNKNSPQVIKKTNPQTAQIVKKTVVQTPSPQIVKKTATQASYNSTPHIIKSVSQTSNKTPQNVIKSASQTQSRVTPQLTSKKATATIVEKPSRPSTKKSNEVTIDLLDDDDDPIISKQVVSSNASRKTSLPGATRNAPEVSNRLNGTNSSTQEMAKSRRSLPAEPIKPVSGGLKRIMPGGQMVVPEKPGGGRGRKSLPGDGGIKRILPGGQMVVPEKSAPTAGRGRKSLPDEPTKAGGLKRIMPGGEMIVPNQQKTSTTKTAEVITLSTSPATKPMPGGANKSSSMNQAVKQTGKSGVKLGQTMKPTQQKPSPAVNNHKNKVMKSQEEKMQDDLRSRGVNIINGKTPSQAKNPNQSSRTPGISQTKTPVNRSQTKTPVNRSQTKTPVNRSQTKTPSNGSQTRTPANASQTKTPANASQTKTPESGAQSKTPANSFKAAKAPASVKTSGKSGKQSAGGRSTQEPELKKVQLSQKQMAALQSLGLM